MRWTQTQAERFWAKVEKTEGCWEWTGFTNADGYGRLYVSEQSGVHYAHRISWELHNGPIPSGLELDHLCNTKTCVNPKHLEPVTHAENIRRSYAHKPNKDRPSRAPSHCRKGHEFTPETTMQPKNSNRQCRVCRLAAQRARYARLRALGWTPQEIAGPPLRRAA